MNSQDLGGLTFALCPGMFPGKLTVTGIQDYVRSWQKTPPPCHYRWHFLRHAEIFPEKGGENVLWSKTWVFTKYLLWKNELVEQVSHEEKREWSIKLPQVELGGQDQNLSG